MKAKYFFFLIIMGFFSACLDSENTFEFEDSNEISFDDCPFYAFWADTLWCADTLRFHTPSNKLALGSKLSIRAFQYMDFQGMPDYIRTSFNFSIYDFQGTGTYRYPTPEDNDWDEFEFKVVFYDVASSRYKIKEVTEGDYGELVITQFDANTGFIKGEARGLLSGTGGEKPKQTLRGGRFQGYVK